ncbi:MAG: hypothetical protein RIT45_3168 [Pseudomonadota bacterium]
MQRMSPLDRSSVRRFGLALLCACLFAAAAPAHAAKAKAAAPLVPPKLVQYAEPETPPEMAARGLRGAVVLQIVVEADGSVGDVKVVQSAGPEFDAAAIEAAKRLRFEPARQGDQPVRVAIQFRYVFAPKVRLDRRGRSAGLGRYDRRAEERAPEGFSSLEGRIVERGTGRPVVGSLVTVPKQQAEAVTDADGRFRFGLLEPGSAEIYVPGAEHRPVRAKVTIREGETTSVTLRATRLSYTIYRATATAPPEPGEATRRSLSVEEIQKIPGVNGDSFKVVQSLPGVARAPGGAGFIIVRGSAPGDTQVFVEGVRLPQLYHFAGIYSIFNTDVLEGIDFLPGGFPVRYGRGTGGVLQARLSLPREQERWKGYVESNVFHTGFFAQGPVGERGNLTLAGRRSYIDAILAVPPLSKALPLTLAPRYYDFQVKYDHRLGPRTSFTAFTFGSDDRLRAVLDAPPAAFPDARGDIETATTFFGALAVLRHDGDGWKSRTTFGSVLTNLNFGLGDLFRFELTSNEFTLRQDFTFGDGPVQLRAGMDWVWQPFTIEVLLPNVAQGPDRGTSAGGPPSAERIFAKQTGSQYQPAIYVDSVFKLRDDLEVVPGVRFDFYRKLADAQTVTPRLNLRWKAREDLTLKAATGTTSQQPQPQQLAESVGTPGLLPQQSWETSAGVEWKATDFLSLDITGFHKRLWNIVVPTDALFPTTPYENSGTGRVIGMELLLRHELANNFFGWISYTLSRATRVDRPGAEERPFGWDQTHIFSILGSYKLPDNWSIGGRWRYVTGNPQTGLSTAVYNEQNDTYTRVSSTCILCQRVPSFHQLDVRVDKTFVFDRFLLGVYLDVQNAYNRGNPEGIQYNFDASLSQYSSGLPLIPSFGVRGEF